MVDRRRLETAALVLPVFGAFLFVPPLLGVFNVAMTLFGIPVIAIYLFSVWFLLIAMTALLSRRLGRGNGNGDAKNGAEGDEMR